MTKYKVFFTLLVTAFFLTLIACSTTDEISSSVTDLSSGTMSETEQIDSPYSTLTLTFGGDLMAHTVNYRMKDYSIIYKDIESILQNDDFSFINLEAPVHSGRPYESYPTFNVQDEYAQAAIDAGFDVFSLANNHSSDQGLEGLKETLAFFEQKEQEGVYHSGLKHTDTEGLSYALLEKRDWKVLFVAVTEILNGLPDMGMVNFIKPYEKYRKPLLEQLRQMKEQIPCDIFILSIHTGEPEYVHSTSQEQKDFYQKILDAGVDVIWANHPHVAKDWELYTHAGSTQQYPQSLIMYAMGNTISGQRSNPSFKAPDTPRDYTGDGYLLQVTFRKESKTAVSKSESDFVSQKSEIPPELNSKVPPELNSEIPPELNSEIPPEHNSKVPPEYNSKVPPEYNSKVPPDFELDLPTKKPEILSTQEILITTYIDPQGNYIIKQLNEDFIQSLIDENRTDWATYLSERKKLMEKIGGKELSR